MQLQDSYVSLYATPFLQKITYTAESSRCFSCLLSIQAVTRPGREKNGRIYEVYESDAIGCCVVHNRRHTRNGASGGSSSVGMASRRGRPTGISRWISSGTDRRTAGTPF